jgi:hypothetical protein
MRPHVRLRPALLALSVVLGATACRTTEPAATPALPRTCVVDVSAQEALTQMTLAASAHGWRIADAGVDSLLVDFGTSELMMPIEDGPSPRATEIHGTALYVVRPVPGGAQIAVVDNPIFWHPDYECWLPGPHGVLPSARLLPPASRGGTR